MRDTETDVVIPDLNVRGKADRVDETDELVRVVDYKTGYLDESPTAYYTGRRLQLELYLLASSEEKEPAGAFYFPAADSFQKEGGGARFAMKGFYNADQTAAFDTACGQGERSELYESGNGLAGGDFRDFLEYGRLVAGQAEEEMRAGNAAPSPYGSACERCSFQSLCAFTGTPREENTVRCAEITKIVREKKGG